MMTPSDPDLARALLIDRLERAGQQQNRHVLQPRHAADVRRQRVAVHLGQVHVDQHDVRLFGLEHLHGPAAVADRRDADVLVRERQFDHALDRDAAVGKKKRSGHRGLKSPRPWASRLPDR